MITNKIQMNNDDDDQIDHSQVLKTTVQDNEFINLIIRIISKI